MIQPNTLRNDKEKKQTDTGEKMSTGFTSITAITAAAHGILSTDLVQPKNKPDWFDDLKNNLDAAKVNARHWIDDLSVDMASTIPKHVIDYGTLFNAMTDEILELLKEKETPDIREKIKELISELQKNVGIILNEVDGMKGRLKKWGKEIEDSHKALTKGVHNIQNTMAELKDDITKIQNQITDLYSKIDAETIALVAGGIAIGVGVFTLCCGITLCCVATPVTIAGGVIVGIASVGAIIGGIADVAAMEIIINNQRNEISKDLDKIKDENLQIVTLQGLYASTNSAITFVQKAYDSLDDVKIMWSVFENELQGVKDKLDNSQETASSIIKEAYIHGAQKEWSLAVNFAQELVGLKLVVKEKKYDHVG